MRSKYEIEEALTPEEIRDAETLWVENLDILGTGQEKYQWYYQKNPCGQGQIWLMRDGNTGKVIGTGGLGNRTILVGGKRLRAGLLADLAICKTHRLLGPVMMLQKRILSVSEDKFDFIYAFPNAGAKVVLKKVGFQEIGTFQRIVKILDYRYAIEKYLPQKTLARTLSMPINLLTGRVMFGKEKTDGSEYVNAGEFSVDPIKYDALWERLEAHGYTLGIRNSDFMRWRYFQCPYIKYGFYQKINSRRDLVSCVIYYTSKEDVHIVDLVIPDYGDRGEFNGLMENFERWCLSQRYGLISISLIGARQLMESFLLRGFIRRGKTQSMMAYPWRNPEIIDCLRDPETSYWFTGDEDNN